MTVGSSSRHRLFLAVRVLLDPRVYLHLLRVVNYYGYSHVTQRRKVCIGAGTRLAPNVSFANGERIRIGSNSNIGARCHLWGGDRRGRVVIGDHVLFGPEVFLTASNYATDAGRRIMDQETVEADVVIGDDVWLGARVIVLPGVTIGSGCVVGAGSVVTRSLPPNSIAVGAPARVVHERFQRIAVCGSGPEDC